MVHFEKKEKQAALGSRTERFLLPNLQRGDADEGEDDR